MTKSTQSQIREINRTLLATVRADWKFPDARPARQNLHHLSHQEPVTYRERYYSTSDGDDGDEDEDDDTSSWTEEQDEDLAELVTTESDETGGDAEGERAPGEPARREKLAFYSPDSVAEYLEKRLQARKRRKRKALVEEMRWNSGLCFFLRRRNAWTGALSPETVRKRESTKDTFLPTATTPDAAETEKELKSTSDGAVDAEASTTEDESTPPSSPPDPQDLAPSSPFDVPPDPSALTDILLPIVPPFLPSTHPVRTSIMSRSPSELYEKVVRDSRTPAVPINLAHMMQVIVQGWKDEGNWPPRGTNVPEPPIAARRHAARTARGLDGAGEAQRGIFANHKHIQKGVESVKRVLRLSGNTPPPGD